MEPGQRVPVQLGLRLTTHVVRDASLPERLPDFAVVCKHEPVQRPVAPHFDFERWRVLYSWIGATRRDWRGQGHFRALSEESESWAIANGFEQIVVKTKNRYYAMRTVLAQLQFDVVKYERDSDDNGASKVYLAKHLPAEIVRDHRSVRTVVQAE